MNLQINRQSFCYRCPAEHSKTCRCKHLHHVHNFAGGCIVCWEEFKKAKEKESMFVNATINVP